MKLTVYQHDEVNGTDVVSHEVQQATTPTEMAREILGSDDDIQWKIEAWGQATDGAAICRPMIDGEPAEWQKGSKRAPLFLIWVGQLPVEPPPPQMKTWTVMGYTQEPGSIDLDEVDYLTEAVSSKEAVTIRQRMERARGNVFVALGCVEDSRWISNRAVCTHRTS